jgi:hypothetical protein
MADDKQKHLVFSILEFLQTSINNGTIKQDDAEGVEGIALTSVPDMDRASNMLLDLDLTPEKGSAQLTFLLPWSLCNPKSNLSLPLFSSRHSVHRRGLWC